MRRYTIEAEVADVLARRVASGRYAAGDRMPSIRRVADEFRVDCAAARRALVQLESIGFVELRPGSGFIVRDVRTDGGMDVFRRLFRMSARTPEAAVELFADIVAEEQLIVQDALLVYTDSERDIDAAELAAGIEDLESLARSENPDPAALLSLELGLVRRLLIAQGRGIQCAMLNSIGDMILDVPHAAAAFYAVSPDVHVLVWRSLAAAWESDSRPTQSQLELFADLFGVYHTKVLARFEELVGAPPVLAHEHVATA